MTEIHPTAIIHPGAEIGENCQIGPYCVVGPHVRLGDGCKLHSHVVIDGHTSLGVGNTIFPFASIGLQTQDLKYRGGITYTRIGDHNTIRESVTINSATGDGEETVVGSYNHICAYSHIAHNVILANRIIMSNVASLAGFVRVEDAVVIGGLAAIHQFCRVGTMSMVGGCSKISQDIPPYMMVDGNPASTRSLNKVGLDRNNVSPETQVALKQAYRLLFREGLTVTNAIKRIEAEVPSLPEVQHLINFARTSERGLSK